MTAAETGKSPGILTPLLIAASVILLISFGVRASFGVFQIQGVPQDALRVDEDGRDPRVSDAGEYPG